MNEKSLTKEHKLSKQFFLEIWSDVFIRKKSYKYHYDYSASIFVKMVN